MALHRVWTGPRAFLLKIGVVPRHLNSCIPVAETHSGPKSQRFLRFAIAMPIADPRISQRFPRQEKAMLHCDLRVRWKVASDLRFQAAISEPKTPSFCGISGDLALSTRKLLAIAIVRFWCATVRRLWNLQTRQHIIKHNAFAYDICPSRWALV